MHALRQSKRLAQLVLVWFVLLIGAGMVSAAVHPSSLQMVCSSAGIVKLVDTGDSDSTPQLARSMECPLCVTVLPPPSLAPTRRDLGSQVALPVPGRPEARVALVVAPPLPPRGPPALVL